MLVVFVVRTWTYRRSHQAVPHESEHAVVQGDTSQMNWQQGNDYTLGYFLEPLAAARDSVQVLRRSL